MNDSGEFTVTAKSKSNNGWEVTTKDFKILVYKEYGGKKIMRKSLSQNINLCWDNNSSFESSDLKNDVVVAIKDSWEKNSDIKFIVDGIE